MRHRSVPVPEEDTARPQVFEDVSELRNYRLRRAADDAQLLLEVRVVVVDILVLVRRVERDRGPLRGRRRFAASGKLLMFLA